MYLFHVSNYASASSAVSWDSHFPFFFLSSFFSFKHTWKPSAVLYQSPCCSHWHCLCCLHWLQHLHHLCHCGQMLTSFFDQEKLLQSTWKSLHICFWACWLQLWWLEVCLILGFCPIAPLTPSFCPPQMNLILIPPKNVLDLPIRKKYKFSWHNYSYCLCIKMNTFGFLCTLLLNKYLTKVKL